MADELKTKLIFIENELPKLMSTEVCLSGQEVIKCSALSKSHLDGFMSSIFTVELLIRDCKKVETVHNLIVKIMKGDESFRKKSKAFLQSANEVLVYKTIIPHFSKFTSGTSIYADGWTAKMFFAECAIYPRLGIEKETILALEDLNTIGFRLSSSKIDLDEDHLRVMARKIASYHAVSFAMKIREDPALEKLAGELIPFHFKSEVQGDLEAYKYLCPISFERLFNYVSNTPKYQDDKAFLKNLENLKKKINVNSLDLMEDFLRNDHQFAVILHGDYYRNNVMFKYEDQGGKEVPIDLRMFDFQEIRYATIAIDLSIFMYMHVGESLKPKLWDELLAYYHEVLVTSLTELLRCDKGDEILAPYNFKSFINHFEKFAFYGVAVSVLSIPWMASPAEDTQKISDYFENDMHHPEFKALLHVCGGEEINVRIVSNVKHASDNGYMKIFE